MPSCDLVGQEYAARVDGEIEVPVGVGQLKGALHGRDAGVGDADVAATQKLERLAERALDRRALAHVDLDSDGICADLLRCSLGCLAIDIGDRHLHAASRERVRNGAADALRAAGYERALAVELRIGRTVCRHHPSHGLARASHINKIGGREGAFYLIMSPPALGCAAQREIPANIRRNRSSASRA